MLSKSVLYCSSRTLWLFFDQTNAVPDHCANHQKKMLRQIALAAACITAAALVAQRTPSTATDDALANLRRAMAQQPAMTRKTFGTASIAAAVTAFARVAEVDASGGATAGGAYLLRAKERYNARVTEGAKAYKKSTDLAALFAEKDGALDDLEAAGFLLANAFRINSTQNPDKIVQVQKFKAFKKDADASCVPCSRRRRRPTRRRPTTRRLGSLDASSVWACRRRGGGGPRRGKSHLVSARRGRLEG